MENVLKGPGEDDLGFTVLKTLFQVLFLILILFILTLGFNFIKKDLLFKVKIPTSCSGLPF